MSKLKGIGNKIIQVSEVQDSRFWIHSFELGFGKWITNKELIELIKEKRKTRDKEIVVEKDKESEMKAFWRDKFEDEEFREKYIREIIYGI